MNRVVVNTDCVLVPNVNAVLLQQQLKYPVALALRAHDRSEHSHARQVPTECFNHAERNR